MPEAWIQRGNSYQRHVYLDDQVPPKINSAMEAVSRVLRECRLAGIVVRVAKQKQSLSVYDLVFDDIRDSSGGEGE